MQIAECIASFLVACRAAGLSPKTTNWYAGMLRTWSEAVGERWLDPDATRGFIVSLQTRAERYVHHPKRRVHDGGLSVFTIRGYVRTVKRFFKWLHDEGRITVNPMTRLQMPKKPKLLPRAITKDDFEKMMESAHLARDRALLLILRDTGCRAAEIAGLRIDDVDLARGVALVCGKGNQQRFVFLQPKTRQALTDWLQERGTFANTDHVFTTQKGNFTLSTVYQVLARRARDAGIEGRFNPHSLRHGFGRDWVLSGGDVSSLADMLGHSDIETTRIYLRFNTAELQRLHQQHSPVRD